MCELVSAHFSMFLVINLCYLSYLVIMLIPLFVCTTSLINLQAVKSVFGREPDMTREGGSIPIANMFEDITGMNVMLLPVGACDDGAHSQNEKFDRINYQNGIKVCGCEDGR